MRLRASASVLSESLAAFLPGTYQHRIGFYLHGPRPPQPHRLPSSLLIENVRRTALHLRPAFSRRDISDQGLRRCVQLERMSGTLGAQYEATDAGLLSPELPASIRRAR